MFVVDVLNLTRQKAPVKDLKAIFKYVAKYLRLEGELSVVLVADKRMKSLNKEFRGKNKSTDVLTFPSNNFTPMSLGEIFINLNDCKRAGKYKEVFSFSPSYHYLLFFLLIHGLLHLAGYSDEREEDRLVMVQKGEKIMKLLHKNAIIKTSY